MDRVGTVHDALCKVSSSKSKVNPKVSPEEFKKLHSGLGLEGDPDKLFAHLDAPGRGVISATSLKWMKDIPDTDEKALARHLTRQFEVQKKKHQKKMKEMQAPRASEARHQAKKSEETQERRSENQEMIKER